MNKPDFSDEPSEVLSKKLHAMCGDLARQVKWSVNGNLTYMSKDDWRHFICAHVKPSQRVLPKADGDGIVILGVSSKSLTKAEKCIALELMYELGSRYNVEWRDPADIAFREHYAQAP